MTLANRVWAWLNQVMDAFRDPDERWEEEEYPDYPKEEDRAASLPVRAARPLETIICTPHEYKDARFVVQSIEEGKVVVLRLMEVDEPLAQRIIDFVSGAVFLLHGTITLYGGDVVLCTPVSVRVEQGDYMHKIPEMPVFRGLT